MYINFWLGERHLLSYTAQGTFAGEMETTKELLAYENGCRKEDITVTVSERRVA